MELFETGLAQMNFVMQPREKKLILSICSGISDKFHNKSRAIRKETKIKKKPYKITLKWYEAYALNVLIFSATPSAVAALPSAPMNSAFTASGFLRAASSLDPSIDKSPP